MTGRQSDMLQATVLADVAIVLLAGAALLRVSRLARQPAVSVEIIAGIVLGPSLLGLLPGHLTTRVFPLDGRPLLSAIAQIGLLLFMFVLGWELEPGHLRGSGPAVVAVAAGGMAVPFALGLGIAPLCYAHHAGSGSRSGGTHASFLTFALYLGIAMSVTAFPVLARILADGGLAATRVGALALASAALGDVVAWCLLAVIVGLAGDGGALGGFAVVAGWSAVYALGMVTVIRPLIRVLTSWLAAAHGAPLAAVIAAGVFLSSFTTAAIGVHPIFGAFAFGIAMPRGPSPELETTVLRPLRETARLLLPVYFIIVGLSVDVGALHGSDWALLALLLGVACVGKLAGATLPARWAGLPWRESLGVGILMNTRGLTELIILNVGLSLHVLDGRLFTLMVLVALLTTALAGPVLPSLVARPQIPDSVAGGDAGPKAVLDRERVAR